MAQPRLQRPIGSDTILKVPERGSLDINKHVWSRLQGQEEFRRLLAKGVLAAVYEPTGVVKLTASCYVGRASFGETVIEITEKVNGAVAALLGYTTHSSFRIERAAAPSSELGGLIAHIVQHFVASVGRYVSRGRGFEYSVEHKVGSLAGGRLNINQTVQLRARGLKHLLAFDKNTISFDTTVHRVLLAALREVEKLARMVQLRPEDVSKARGMALLFDDSRDAELLFAPRGRFAQLAQDILEQQTLPETRDMLALAGVVLSHESFELSPVSREVVPRAWFLNIENLFENAVRQVLAELLGDKRTVGRGSEFSRGVFKPDTGGFKAYPDLVVADTDSFVAIGDVKYKNWTGDAVASDIYQLLVHAAVFDSTKCFLVFPSDGFDMRCLGNAATNSVAWLFSVDVTNLHRDLGLVLAELGLAPAAGQSALAVAVATEAVSGGR